MILSRIELFPIKSLPGVSVERAGVLMSGALELDRRFALCDGEGRLVNAKRTATIHWISADYDLQAMSVRLSRNDFMANEAMPVGEEFSLIENRSQIADWFSDVFEERIHLVENCSGGFPDDPEAPGPTVVSRATLETVADWFELPVEQIRHRFRTNLEIAGVEAFWEDGLFAHEGAGRRFLIGDVEFVGVKPCRRCVVPSRDPQTGRVIRGFSSEFSRRRELTLPGWADLSRFDHFYRLAMNTALSGRQGGDIQVGQPVVIR